MADVKDQLMSKINRCQRSTTSPERPTLKPVGRRRRKTARLPIAEKGCGGAEAPCCPRRQFCPFAGISLCSGGTIGPSFRRGIAVALLGDYVSLLVHDRRLAIHGLCRAAPPIRWNRTRTSSWEADATGTAPAVDWRAIVLIF